MVGLAAARDRLRDDSRFCQVLTSLAKHLQGRPAVQQPRVSTAKLMGLIAIVALNVAGGRLLLDYDVYILAAIAPPAIAIQLALVRLRYGRNLSRAFWAGFIIAIIFVAALCVWGMVQGRSTKPSFNPMLGKNELLTLPGNPMWPGWISYRRYAYETILRIPNGRAILYGDDMTLISMPIFAGVMFLPQLLVALGGGLLALYIAGLCRFCRRFGSSRP
jgi:hypothetical protein